MLRTFFAAISFIAPGIAVADDDPQPATVVVAFNRETVVPLIVEGVRNRESGDLVTANDPVRIASISKLVMAIAALRLADEGKVDIHADISDYLGWKVRAPGFPDAKVTLAQLLSHRSGLRDDAGYVIPLGESLQAKLAEPAAWYPDAPPGEAPFEYANLGSPVAATVLEAATGERYDRLIERTVFAPLGVKACLNWIGCDEEMVARAVTLYRDTGEIARDDAADLPPNCTIPVAEGVECSLDDYVPGTNASIFSPQGGVRIGMLDLAKIAQMLMAGPDTDFLTMEAHRAQLMPIITQPLEPLADQDFFCAYGLGIQMIEQPGRDCQDTLFADGYQHFGHAGEAYGLRSGLWNADHTYVGVVYFTTAVPPRQSAEDQGGFDAREIALMARAQAMLEKIMPD
ncbi:serine hydrolase [Erythrobacter sp. JK5]|uniref:serine hydrolase domain-containing protein n=1 Tax=Erythrobacter sp. JK5 TaxID=2829500 RepID=UPI001BADF4FD|nr:serine hydrolase domain-containing protein [Erythrobacter sp. JK5]QUL37839.1 beta-lactamase family protein [Erythrobacter sp. JK5]